MTDDAPAPSTTPPGPDITTWSALLAHWTDFARASVALPDDGEGGRWKRAVPHIIALQATTMALGEIDRLDDSERPVAIDRSEITCRDAVGAIHDLWRGEPVPELVVELIDDSRVAFERAANAGVEWVVTAERVVCDHPAELVAGLRKAGFAGELFVPAPGQPVFRGAPAAFARGPAGTAPSDAQLAVIGKYLGRGSVSEPERIGLPRQIYRQFDFAAGGPVKDLVVPMNEDLPSGQPVLILAIEGGEPVSVPLPPRETPRIETLPVEIFGAETSAND